MFIPPRLRPLLLFLLILTMHGVRAGKSHAEPAWALSFSDTGTLPSEGQGSLDTRSDRSSLRISRQEVEGSSLRTFPVPIESLRGKWIFLEAGIKANAVGEKPKDWNGIKVMLKLETPQGDEWPQITLPVGTFDWTNFSTRIYIPEEAASAVLHLGLEHVSGTAWFENLRITVAQERLAPPAAPANQPIFKGHGLPRLRGAMAHPEMTREDLHVFAKEWGGNLIRWQLLYIPIKGEEQNLAAYDLWLDKALAKLDQVIAWSRPLGVKIVVDLHSPPSGEISGGGFAAATGAFLKSPAAQQHFLEVWRKIAIRYKGESTVIWGFDLLNEPDDRAVIAPCDDWQTLAEKTARAVREIDPARTLIVEPNTWGSPEGFAGFHPIPFSNVVYSFHMYAPFSYTHQGVNHPANPVAYPGEIDGKRWNKETLRQTLAPAIAFAAKYRVHLYVGEFSVLRWAPGADEYLSDLTEIFESQGWDWSYHSYREWHGWNLELGEDRDDQATKPSSSARREAILRWMKENPKSRNP